jgi:hypothetical protein
MPHFALPAASLKQIAEKRAACGLSGARGHIVADPFGSRRGRHFVGEGTETK